MDNTIELFIWKFSILIRLFYLKRYLPVKVVIENGLSMLMKLIGKFLDTLVDRIVSVIGAVIFSQLPQMIMQYKRVLEGALAEAAKNILVARSKAHELGLSLKEFINAHLRNSDPVFQKSGEVYEQALLRHDNYQTALQALNDAGIWTRPFVFLKHVDGVLFSNMQFEPGLPLTVEGAVYALFGILCALALYHGVLKQPFRFFTRKKRKEKKSQNSDAVKS